MKSDHKNNIKYTYQYQILNILLEYIFRIFQKGNIFQKMFQE